MSMVLVVDDSLTDRKRAGGLLTRAGFEVDYACDGREAMERLAVRMADAVVSDMLMPEMDGLALVTAAAREFPFLPIVVVTSQGSETAAVQALQAGAASYVPKRDLATQLADTVRRICHAAGESRDVARVHERIVRHEVRYEFESDLSLIPPAVRVVRELLSGLRRLDEAAVLRTAIAFEEALLNAVYHGNLEVSSVLRDADANAYYELAQQRSEQSPYRERLVTIDVSLSIDEARFRIADEGVGFDPALLPDPTDPENIARASGRGLLLIKTFMDEVIHNDRGNEILLVKRLPPSRRARPARLGEAMSAS